MISIFSFVTSLFLISGDLDFVRVKFSQLPLIGCCLGGSSNNVVSEFLQSSGKEIEILDFLNGLTFGFMKQKTYLIKVSNPLTNFSSILRFIKKPVIWFAVQIKRLISTWNAKINFIKQKTLIKVSNSLTNFRSILHLVQNPVIWFAVQIKWLVSILNATLGWNRLD